MVITYFIESSNIEKFCQKKNTLHFNGHIKKVNQRIHSVRFIVAFKKKNIHI